MSELQLNIANLSYEEFCEHFFNKKYHVPKSELIRKLKNRIHQFEEKYGMTTEKFIPRYESGEFEMDDDYPDHDLFSWWCDYISYHRLLQRNGK